MSAFPMAAGVIATKLGLNPMQMMGLLRFQGVTAAQLTPELILEMATTMGFNHPSVAALSELVNQAKTDNPENIWDWLSTPDRLTQVVGALKGEEPAELVRCPLCRHLFSIEGKAQ